MGRDTPSLRARWLGAKLAELRIGAGLKSLSAAADRAGRSTASLSRIENGIVYLPPRDLPPILDAYGVVDQRMREKLMIAAVEVQQERRGWWLDHGDALSPSYLDLIRLEDTAAEIRTYETHFVPGLLQTEEYTRAVAAASWEPENEARLDEFTAVRMNRKTILARDEPIDFKVILSEAVLRHPVGGADVFGEQLQYLRACSALRNICIQVLPFAGRPHPGMAGAFTALRLPSLDVVHVELMNSDAYIEDEVLVDQYLRAFDQLRGLALDPAESEEVIVRAIDTL